MVTVAGTIRAHAAGILRWLHSRISNGMLEAMNSLVQAAKVRARGYRTTEHFHHHGLPRPRKAHFQLEKRLAMVNSRGVLFMAMLAAVSMAGCDSSPLKPNPAPITITVVDPLSEVTSLPGATAICISGCQNHQIGTTDNLGQTTLTGFEPITVRVEKDWYISVEQQVFSGDTIVLERDLVEVNIAVELPYPEDSLDVRVGVPEATVTCVDGCESRQIEVTDSQGAATLIGWVLPITIRVEKIGFVTVEQQVHGGRVNMGHEWPAELEQSILQLDLDSAIANGELFLIWGDEEYIDADGWGQFSCPTIIIKQIEDDDFMFAILAHENMHAWQGRRSNNPPCDLHYGYPPTEEAKSWIEAWEKDTLEHGPYPGIDDTEWGMTLLENQAAIYGHWYWGPETERLVEDPETADKKAALEKLYRLAPNRCRYLEDRFGPPPPR